MDECTVRWVDGFIYSAALSSLTAVYTTYAGVKLSLRSETNIQYLIKSDVMSSAARSGYWMQLEYFSFRRDIKL